MYLQSSLGALNMTPNIQLSSEPALTMNYWGFQPTNVTETSVSGVHMAHVTVDMARTHPDSSHSIAIADLVAERERDPRKQAAIFRARQKLAGVLSGAPECALARLRLQSGLSQARLAEVSELKQPCVARSE